MSSTLVQPSVRVTIRTGSQGTRPIGPIGPRQPTRPASGTLRTASVREECAFGAFGKWCTRDIALTGAANYSALARWIVLHGSALPDRAAKWNACVAAHKNGFKIFRGMNMFDSSLHLPCGQVVFQYQEEPSQIPDRPPEAILGQLVKAILAHRDSTLYCLEPVFDVTSGAAPALLTVPALIEQAKAEVRAVFALVERYGWLYQIQNRAEQIAHRAGEIALATAARVVEWFERRSLKAEIRRIGSGTRDFQSYLYEEEVVRLKRLSDRARLLEMVEVSGSFSAAIERLRKIDPVLTFVLPNESIHRFIGHWYWTIDSEGHPVVKCHV